MSRITITEKFADLELYHKTPPISPTLNRSSPHNRAVSITRRVRAALAFTTSHDTYYNKSHEIFSVAMKDQDLKKYLNKRNDNEKSINPRFLNQKITHIAKLVNANGAKDEEIYAGINRRPLRKSTHSANPTDSMDTSIYKKDISRAISSNAQEILLQKRCNQILYSENYLERLKARYEKYQQKNENLQKSLAKSIAKHWED